MMGPFRKAASRVGAAFGFAAPPTTARHNGPQSTTAKPTAHMPHRGR